MSDVKLLDEYHGPGMRSEPRLPEAEELFTQLTAQEWLGQIYRRLHGTPRSEREGRLPYVYINTISQGSREPAFGLFRQGFTDVVYEWLSGRGLQCDHPTLDHELGRLFTEDPEEQSVSVDLAGATITSNACWVPDPTAADFSPALVGYFIMIEHQSECGASDTAGDRVHSYRAQYLGGMALSPID